MTVATEINDGLGLSATSLPARTLFSPPSSNGRPHIQSTTPFFDFVEMPGQFVARILAVMAGLVALFLAVVQLLFPGSAANFALAVPLAIVGLVVCAVEGSPELIGVVETLLPAVRKLDERAVLYLVLGCIIQGSTWSANLALAGGFCLQGAGILMGLAAINRKNIMAARDAATGGVQKAPAASFTDTFGIPDDGDNGADIKPWPHDAPGATEEQLGVEAAMMYTEV